MLCAPMLTSHILLQAGGEFVAKIGQHLGVSVTVTALLGNSLQRLKQVGDPAWPVAQSLVWEQPIPIINRSQSTVEN
jgi:hypothetical protein